ncbi:MAG: YbgC/FadM family acyl-CoA thioesterase [Gammaproteobacteria bacterium]|nr:YbgC/FadM family acyl-CoA thioesterase [Gammaproteobacteria bacterium]
MPVESVSTDNALPHVAGFEHPLRVYYEDTDAAGIVYHANYLRYMERARTVWLSSLGVEIDQLVKQYAVLFAVRSLNVQYLRPARLNNHLIATVWPERLGGASLELDQRVFHEGELLTSAHVKLACVDAITLLPKPWPQVLHELFNAWKMS